MEILKEAVTVRNAVAYRTEDNHVKVMHYDTIIFDGQVRPDGRVKMFACLPVSNSSAKAIRQVMHYLGMPARPDVVTKLLYGTSKRVALDMMTDYHKYETGNDIRRSEVVGRIKEMEA